MSAEQVVRRLVSAAKLEEAKARRGEDAARAEGVSLARWLVDSGWISGDEWAREAAGLLGVAFTEHLPAPDPSVRDRWPVEFFRRHQTAPIAVREGRLEIAVWDPTDRENLEAIESKVRMPLAIVCAALTAIQSRTAEGASPEAPAQTDLEVDEPQTEPHLRLLHDILRGAVKRGATDVHLEAGDRLAARLRVDGLVGPSIWSADAPAGERLVNRIRVLGGMDVTESRLPQDGSFRMRTGGRAVDVRVSLVPAAGTSVVLRLLDRERIGGSDLSLERLGFLAPEREALLAAAKRPHGLLLMIGPTGSGKSTTLHAALREAADPTRKLVTIEDPVEYRLAGATQVEVDERVGLTFAAGLRSLLRHDPDRILVGEIRDADTARVAVQAALTGHLVLTSLHATSREHVARRLRSLDVDEDALGDVLSVVASQRLVRRTCGGCEGKGCAACDGSGLRGRRALVEVSARRDGRLAPVRPIQEVAREVLAAGGTARAEIERVWPEALG